MSLELGLRLEKGAERPLYVKRINIQGFSLWSYWDDMGCALGHVVVAKRTVGRLAR